MVIQLPNRNFYAPDELAEKWAVTIEDIWACLIAGSLKAHARVPLVGVLTLPTACQHQDSAQRLVTTWEGYSPLSRYQCQRFYEQGRMHLREFICEDKQARYALPDEADDLRVNNKRFGILNTERLRFENKYGVKGEEDAEAEVSHGFDPTFRSIRYKRDIYYFGELQSAILSALYDASKTQSPWVNGKQLLHQVGSESYSLMQLFKHHPIGRKLIISDRKGYYRFNSVLLE